MIVYKILNKVNSKVYVGQTTLPLEQRMKKHFTNRKRLINQAIRKYGRDNFEVTIIDRATSLDELYEKEIYWISYYDCLAPNGYNLNQGGHGGQRGYRHTEQSKEKMKKYHRENPRVGADCYQYGQKFSEEHKAKIGATLRAQGNKPWNSGSKLSPEHRQNAANAYGVI